MKTNSNKLKNGAKAKVIAGTHIGKAGMVQDIHESKTGHITVTIVQKNGERFKTLGRNVTLM